MAFAAYLDHEDWNQPLFFTSEISAADAEEKAVKRLHIETEGYRDRDEYPTDEEWLDVCLSESWSIASGEVQA